jgi:type IV secretory pathway VirJ component
MAVLITGDGGWAGFDQNIAGKLAANGVAVVGLNSLKYFWTARTPIGASRDLAQILGHYLIAWKKEKAMLIGYSLGADVLPFMVARLPADIRQRIALIALLAPSRQTAFEFHLSDWIGGSAGKEQYATGPEVSKLTELPLLCFYGKEENESLCRAPLPPKAAVIPMPGGHHLSGDADFIVGQALGTLKRPYR